MIINRKDFLRSAGAFALARPPRAAVAPARSRSRISEPGPSPDVRLPAGAAPTFSCAILARSCATVSGRNVIVENKPGANSNIATDACRALEARWRTRSIRSRVRRLPQRWRCSRNPPVDVGKTIRAVATTSNLAFMLMVDAKSPYKTVAELTEAMKKKAAMRATPLRPIRVSSWPRSTRKRPALTR